MREPAALPRVGVGDVEPARTAAGGDDDGARAHRPLGALDRERIGAQARDLAVRDLDAPVHDVGEQRTHEVGAGGRRAGPVAQRAEVDQLPARGERVVGDDAQVPLGARPGGGEAGDAGAHDHDVPVGAHQGSSSIRRLTGTPCTWFCTKPLDWLRLALPASTIPMSAARGTIGTSRSGSVPA